MKEVTPESGYKVIEIDISEPDKIWQTIQDILGESDSVLSSVILIGMKEYLNCMVGSAIKLFEKHEDQFTTEDVSSYISLIVHELITLAKAVRKNSDLIDFIDTETKHSKVRFTGFDKEKSLKVVERLGNLMANSFTNT